ncbi:hypothetical protein SNOG_11963 [Parastagonospora nodorum SN15]|uniref:Uncharacterized protein n=1 Tax=Phaeosphaeria nodorum (strain SN15 / ATCC MYA-4574 / FGSC 10173) TaxID=321614 RepID=Q0U8F1_PHANO|nr:hypothetical protein SNOG_11963 [Parastagonospora nodorum SN15]EAT80375.1 hypothetical protein SNOG_11963 [Parastagonospora nodorum SN15]
MSLLLLLLFNFELLRLSSSCYMILFFLRKKSLETVEAGE